MPGKSSNLTRAERAAQHQQQAETALRRSGRRLRLDAQILQCSRATAHATLALSYLVEPGEQDVVVAIGEDDDDDEE